MSLIINDKYKLKILEALSKESGLSKNKIKKRVDCDSKKTTDSAIEFLVHIKAIEEQTEDKLQRRYFHYYILPLGNHILNNTHNKDTPESILEETITIAPPPPVEPPSTAELYKLEEMFEDGRNANIIPYSDLSKVRSIIYTYNNTKIVKMKR